MGGLAQPMFLSVGSHTTEAAPVFAVFEEPALSQAEGPGISAAGAIPVLAFFGTTLPRR